MEEHEKRLQLIKAETGTGNTIAVSASYLIGHREAINRGKIPIYKVIRLPDGKLEVEPVNIGDLSSTPSELLEKRQFVIPKDWESRVPVKVRVAAAPDPFETKVKAYVSVSPEERVREVTAIKSTLEDLKKANAPPEQKAMAIMDAVQSIFVINKASLRLNRSDVGVHERTIAQETQAVVSSVLGMVEESETTIKLFDCFKSLSNGQTINHISRVFSTMITFMHFYNSLHQRRIAQGLRLVFENEFADIYRYIMGPMPNHLFVSDNIVPLPLISPPEMKRYALGAFLHDIGKMANLDYFESDLAYDPNQIRQHVFISVQLILMNYGTEHEDARLMAGDHHNALFHKDGYGLTRLERERGMRPPLETERCISGIADEFTTGKAKGFLPTEILAICDIYDAMTDASRTYKKAMTPNEAVAFMFDKPMSAGKIDPVLFSLFVDFLHSTKLDVDLTYGMDYKIKHRHS